MHHACDRCARRLGLTHVVGISANQRSRPSQDTRAKTSPWAVASVARSRRILILSLSRLLSPTHRSVATGEASYPKKFVWSRPWRPLPAGPCEAGQQVGSRACRRAPLPWTVRPDRSRWYRRARRWSRRLPRGSGPRPPRREPALLRRRGHDVIPTAVLSMGFFVTGLPQLSGPASI